MSRTWMVFDEPARKITINGLPDSGPFAVDIQQVVGTMPIGCKNNL